MRVRIAIIALYLGGFGFILLQNDISLSSTWAIRLGNFLLGIGLGISLALDPAPSKVAMAERAVVEAAMKWWSEWDVRPGAERERKMTLTETLNAACAALQALKAKEGGAC